MSRYKLTTEEFIEKAKKIHGDKYDYSKVDYKHSKIPVKILCKIHGYYNQMPVNHLQGSGCPKCGSTYRLDVEEFVKKARRVHGDLYNYSNVEYKNSKTPIKIFCKIHGYFSQIPAAHLQGHGCPKCNHGFSSDSKLSLLSDSDVEHLSTHQLIELIGQNLLPADFKVLTKSAAGSKDRKDDINKLRESIGSGTEDETADEVGEQVLQEEQLEFEDAQNSAADDSTDNLLNVLPDLVTKGLTTYDKYFVSSGEKGAYLLKESVNKIWNCVLSSESYLETVKKMRESSGPWLTYVLDTFMMEYKSVQNERVGPDYKFEYPPSLMQKLMSYRIATNPYYGNWCGTGAGKTNAFLIASRRIDARVTVCVCPNAVVETIRKSILRVYPESTIIIPKSLDDIVSYDRSKYNCVILNYEKFCQSYSPALVDKLVGLNQIDFLCFENSEVGDIEGHMIQVKYEGIRSHIKKYRTIIYTQFIKNILPRIKEELRKDGITFREYTGEIDSVERVSIACQRHEGLETILSKS